MPKGSKKSSLYPDGKEDGLGCSLSPLYFRDGGRSAD
jgi:hypothetical protein